jgi:hypothetical protein
MRYKHETDYEVEQITEKLIGFKIIGAVQSPCSEYFGLHLRKGRKDIKVWVDRDPEGNGAGHLSIESALTV